MTNSVQAKIDETPQNSKSRLHGEKDETINHTINECSKLGQKGYKTRNDWAGKVIHMELRKKLKFDHINKWYMHNPEFVQENMVFKFLWNCEIKTDQLISARRPDLVIVNKKEDPPNSRLCRPGRPQNEIKRNWKER